MTDRMQTDPADQVMVFGRYPLPDSTKKRLIGRLGAIGAAALQRELTAACVADSGSNAEFSAGMNWTELH